MKRSGAEIPFGALISHGDHSILVRWDDGSVALQSVHPLEFHGAVECAVCGRVEEGRA